MIVVVLAMALVATSLTQCSTVVVIAVSASRLEG